MRLSNDGLLVLTDEEFYEIGFVISQITDPEIRAIYAKLNLPEEEKVKSATNAITARRKIFDAWKKKQQ